MMKSDLVSIIIPAFHAEKHIGTAIESVLGQTYKNWELIVIDDGSADATAETVRAYAAADSRIRFYQNEKNAGVAATRNCGFALAQGQWVALLDSDDCWHAAKLEKQLQTAAETKAQILYCSYALTDHNRGTRRPYVVPVHTDYLDMLKENIIGCSTVMLKREITDTYRFDPSFAHEDYALWLELLKAGYKAAGCEEVLVDYMIRKGSRSSNKWTAAKNRWKILRQGQGLPLRQAMAAFCTYAIRGAVKHGT